MSDDRFGFPPARSALRLRLILALFGLVVTVAGTVVFAVYGPVVLAVLCGLVILITAVDLIIITRRIRRELPRHGTGP
ncbi:MAG: DUF6343 family protein [Frankia sp.]